VERLERENECKDTLIETLQAQLVASEEERRKVSATCDMLGRERNAADEEVHSLKQQVAQLRDSTVLKGDYESLAQRYRHMERQLETLQTAHTALRGLVEQLPVVTGEIMVSGSMVLAEDPDVCSDMSDKEEAEAYAALLTYRATLPREGGAQPPQGKMHSCDIPECVSCNNPSDPDGGEHE